jgi:hypothetical protein
MLIRAFAKGHAARRARELPDQLIGWVFFVRFIRRVTAKLTYPTYSGMHTLVVGFLTVSTHC